MSRLFLIALMAAIGLLSQVPAADDPIVAELTKAKQDYQAAIEAANKKLLAAFADQQKKLEDSKSLKVELQIKLVEQIQEERKAFETDAANLPKSMNMKVAVSDYKTALATARKKCESAFDKAAAAYRDKKDLAGAKVVLGEKDSFFKGDAKHPADAVKFGKKHYKLYETVLSWFNAKKRCEDAGGRLACIENAEEQEFLHGMLKKSKVPDAWIGATDEKKEGEWLWVTGKKLTYANWAKTQPNNKDNVEHYAVMVGSQNGQWSDQPNISKELKPGYFCEWE